MVCFPVLDLTNLNSFIYLFVVFFRFSYPLCFSINLVRTVDKQKQPGYIIIAGDLLIMSLAFSPLFTFTTLVRPHGVGLLLPPKDQTGASGAGNLKRSYYDPKKLAVDWKGRLKRQSRSLSLMRIPQTHIVYIHFFFSSLFLFGY